MTLIRPENSRFALALAVSLLFHIMVLAINRTMPEQRNRMQESQADSRVDVTLAPGQKSPPPSRPPQTRERRPELLAMPPRQDAARTWSRAERDEVDHFLNELAAPPQPTGRALAQRALTMARDMHHPEPIDNSESREIMRRLDAAKVDPYSLEMYFDALFGKMNRSAAMLGRRQRDRGAGVATVRIMLNQDGSVRGFEILRAADQLSEIAFIRSVVELAAPFPAFPPDIRKATDALALLICIRPGISAGGSGAMFTRMADGEACR